MRAVFQNYVFWYKFTSIGKSYALSFKRYQSEENPIKNDWEREGWSWGVWSIFRTIRQWELYRESGTTHGTRRAFASLATHQKVRPGRPTLSRSALVCFVSSCSFYTKMKILKQKKARRSSGMWCSVSSLCWWQTEKKKKRIVNAWTPTMMTERRSTWILFDFLWVS